MSLDEQVIVARHAARKAGRGELLVRGRFEEQQAKVNVVAAGPANHLQKGSGRSSGEVARGGLKT